MSILQLASSNGSTLLNKFRDHPTRCQNIYNIGWKKRLNQPSTNIIKQGVETYPTLVGREDWTNHRPTSSNKVSKRIQHWLEEKIEPTIDQHHPTRCPNVSNIGWKRILNQSSTNIIQQGVQTYPILVGREYWTNHRPTSSNKVYKGIPYWLEEKIEPIIDQHPTRCPNVSNIGWKRRLNQSSTNIIQQGVQTYPTLVGREDWTNHRPTSFNKASKRIQHWLEEKIEPTIDQHHPTRVQTYPTLVGREDWTNHWPTSSNKVSKRIQHWLEEKIEPTIDQHHPTRCPNVSNIGWKRRLNQPSTNIIQQGVQMYPTLVGRKDWTNHWPTSSNKGPNVSNIGWKRRLNQPLTNIIQQGVQTYPTLVGREDWTNHRPTSSNKVSKRIQYWLEEKIEPIIDQHHPTRCTKVSHIGWKRRLNHSSTNNIQQGVQTYPTLVGREDWTNHRPTSFNKASKRIQHWLEEKIEPTIDQHHPTRVQTYPTLVGREDWTNHWPTSSNKVSKRIQHWLEEKIEPTIDQHHPTRRPNVSNIGWKRRLNQSSTKIIQQGAQTCSTCCIQQCWMMLDQHFGCVWSSLKVWHGLPKCNENHGGEFVFWALCCLIGLELLNVN